MPTVSVIAVETKRVKVNGTTYCTYGLQPLRRRPNYFRLLASPLTVDVPCLTVLVPRLMRVLT